MGSIVRTEKARIIPILATLGLVAGMLALLTPSAAAATPPCKVTNRQTLVVYGGSGSNLQTAIDEASPGVRLRIRGVCVGNFSIGKDLTLKGFRTAAYPTPTLNGNAADTVLTVNAGLVRLLDLKITNGRAEVAGGGISNAGTLNLNGSTLVTGNTAAWAVGSPAAVISAWADRARCRVTLRPVMEGGSTTS